MQQVIRSYIKFKNINIAKAKQIFHGAVPALLLIILPKSVLTGFVALIYMMIAISVYYGIKKIVDDEVLVITNIISAILIVGYVESL